MVVSCAELGTSLMIQAWCKLALQCIGVMNYRIETTTHSELSWREIVEIFLVNYSCGSRWADFRRVHVKAFHSYYGSCIFVDIKHILTMAISFNDWHIRYIVG